MFDSKTIIAALLAALLSMTVSAASGPEEDRRAFNAYFENRFPDVERDEYGNGAYALDAAAREQWLQYEEFPPYELYVDDGQELFEKHPLPTAVATLIASRAAALAYGKTTRTGTMSAVKS